jgi:hypothetical protein
MGFHICGYNVQLYTRDFFVTVGTVVEVRGGGFGTFRSEILFLEGLLSGFSEPGCEFRFRHLLGVEF